DVQIQAGDGGAVRAPLRELPQEIPVDDLWHGTILSFPSGIPPSTPAGHWMVTRSSLAGESSPSSLASIMPRSASRNSRPAATRCPTNSGLTSPTAVTAMHSGQNGTEHSGRGAAGAGAGRTPRPVV